MTLRKSIIKLLFQASLIVLLFTSANSIAQEDNSVESYQDIMTSVYNDVWKPFMESYRELNIEKFKSIQANDLTRVSIDKNTISSKSKYLLEIESFFNYIKRANRQMDIKFSILTSATGNDRVYQTGYYGIVSRGSDSETFQPMGYGYFTVVMIKEDGLWKISLDADKNAAIGEEEFRQSDVIYELD